MGDATSTTTTPTSWQHVMFPVRNRLGELPSEILAMITDLLPTLALCSLRLTCRLIDNKTFHRFAYEFFQRKQFMLTPFSMQALVDISHSSRIAPYLSELHIGTDRYPQSVVGRSQDDRQLVDGALSQRAFFSFGVDTDRLAEAMANLPNLHKIVIRNTNRYGRRLDRHEHSTSEALSGLWRSYGSVTVDRTVQMGNLSMDESDEAYVYCIWSTILKAWARVPTSKLDHVEFLLRGDAFLLDKSLDLPSFLSPKITAQLDHLTTLHLRILFSTAGVGNYHLESFLLRTPNLRHLRINVFDRRMYARSDESVAAFLSWLGQDPQYHSRYRDAPPFSNFQHLKRLDLGGFDHINLSRFLLIPNRFASSLEELCLHYFALLPANTSTLEDDRYWSIALNALAKMEKLHSLSLQSLSVHKGGGIGRVFVILPDAHGDDGKSITYRGLAMKKFCTSLAQNIKLHIPPIHTADFTSSNPSSADSDSEETDEDDEVVTTTLDGFPSIIVLP